MHRDDLVDLNAFMTVAEEQSFTKAALRLNTSQSALSLAVKRLEDRNGVRLLNRTTRKVSLTEAGNLLLQTLSPSLGQIEDALANVGKMRDRPMGTIRLLIPEHALLPNLWPRLNAFVARYPDVKLDIETNQGESDILEGRFDAGVRLSEDVEKDMVSIRVGSDMRMAVTATPEYFAKRGRPSSPAELAGHTCINYRRPLTGRVTLWEFAKGAQVLRVKVEGQLTFNRLVPILAACRSGRGLCCVPEDMVAEDISRGTLVRVLEEWCPPFPGFHLFYPSRLNHSSAFALLIESLRLGNDA